MRDNFLVNSGQALDELRHIEGFPIGEDEDLHALSDPSYYTAYPNPHLPEIIARWQAERAEIRARLGLPDDSADDAEFANPQSEIVPQARGCS